MKKIVVDSDASHRCETVRVFEVCESHDLCAEAAFPIAYEQLLSALQPKIRKSWDSMKNANKKKKAVISKVFFDSYFIAHKIFHVL